MVYKVIGLMSGSSLDGLDIVYTELEDSGGAWTYKIIASTCATYSEEWIHRLQNAPILNAYDYHLLHSAYGKLTGEIVNKFIDESEQEFLDKLKTALLASFVITYAQGLSLLQAASIEKNYGLNLSEITKIWRGGCIIRSALLEDMRRAFAENPDLPNLILDDKFAEILNAQREDWRAR